MVSKPRLLRRPLVLLGLGIACLLHAACFPAREAARSIPKANVSLTP